MAAEAIDMDSDLWADVEPHVVILTEAQALTQARIIEWIQTNGEGRFSWRWEAVHPKSDPGYPGYPGYRMQIRFQFTDLTSAMAFKMACG